MEYPEDVITKNKKGQIEVRTLIRRGNFIEYDYRDPKTGKTVEAGKRSIILIDGKKQEHYFIIPLKQRGKFLMVVPKEEKPSRKIWNGKKAIKV